MNEYRNRTRELYTNPDSSGPNVYGSRRPCDFLTDLSNGSDSLDVLVIGDSNTMSASAGAYGYHNGLSQAFQNKGWNCYGTSVYPTMTSWEPGAVGSKYSLGGWNSTAYISRVTGNLASGNSSGGGTAYSVWTPGTNWVRYGSYTATPPAKDDWAYIASGTYSDDYNAIDVEAIHPLNTSALTLWHRLRWGSFNSGSGSFRGRTRNYSSGAVYATGPSQSTNTGVSYSYSAYEYSFTPVGVNTTKFNSSWSGPTATGPCAILNQSIYCKRKGWAVTSHGYISGGNSSTISTIISGIGNTPLSNQLKEIRERQISAGGTGRVLLFVHSGINGADTGSTWTAAHKSIWNTYKSAWSALGYPATDLAIVSMVGAPRNSADTSNGSASLPAVRTAANDMALQNPDMTVVDVKKLVPYTALSYGIGISNKTYYQNNTTSDVHLSDPSGTNSNGYEVVSSHIINQLLSAQRN